MIKVNRIILIILKILKKTLKILSLILILDYNLILDPRSLEIKKGAIIIILKRIFIIDAYRLSESI